MFSKKKPAQIAHPYILNTISDINLILETLKRNNSIKSKDGREVHFLFPLTGMAGMGEFFKGYLEQILPKSRFTFLVTPPSTSSTRYRLNNFDSKNTTTLIENLINLKKNFKKTVNVNDRVFIVIDHFVMEKTLKNITFVIKEYFKGQKTSPEIYGINSFAEHNSNDLLRVYEGKTNSGSNVFSEHHDVKSKKEIEQIKEREKVIKYTFYYLGWLTAMQKKAANR